VRCKQQRVGGKGRLCGRLCVGKCFRETEHQGLEQKLGGLRARKEVVEDWTREWKRDHRMLRKNSGANRHATMIMRVDVAGWP
jgi:hypothetical protein